MRRAEPEFALAVVNQLHLTSVAYDGSPDWADSRCGGQEGRVRALSRGRVDIQTRIDGGTHDRNASTAAVARLRCSLRRRSCRRPDLHEQARSRAFRGCRHARPPRREGALSRRDDDLRRSLLPVGARRESDHPAARNGWPALLPLSQGQMRVLAFSEWRTHSQGRDSGWSAASHVYRTCQRRRSEATRCRSSMSVRVRRSCRASARRNRRPLRLRFLPRQAMSRQARRNRDPCRSRSNREPLRFLP